MTGTKNESFKHSYEGKHAQHNGSIKNIIVLGAGYGGLTAALRLEKLLRNLPQYQIHLIDRHPYHTIKTQLHEAAVRKTEVTIPIDRILRNRKIIFHLGKLTKIDSNNQILQIGEKMLRFDYLIIAIGSKVNYYSIPGVERYSFPLQTFDNAESIYNHISNMFALAASESNFDKRNEMLCFVIGGGGLAGVEFAGELHDQVHIKLKNYNIPSDECEIIIIELANRIVPSMEEGFSIRVYKELTDKGIKIKTGSKIIERTENTVALLNGEILKTKTLIWTGGIKISSLLHEGGIKTAINGRIIVDRYLRASDYPFIYAIGDNSLAINPKTGNAMTPAAQFALQQGRLVANNIFAEITGRNRLEYIPKVLGEVVSLGRHLAIGWIALPLLKKVTFAGFLISLLKTAIGEKHILLLRKESRNWIRV